MDLLKVEIPKYIDNPKDFFNYILAVRDVNRSIIEKKKLEFATRTPYLIPNGKKVYHVLPNGTRHGLYQLFSFNDKLREEVMYVDGKKEGLSKTWYESGDLQETMMYVDGIKHGLFQLFYDNGQVWKAYKGHGIRMVSYGVKFDMLMVKEKVSIRYGRLMESYILNQCMLMVRCMVCISHGMIMVNYGMKLCMLMMQEKECIGHGLMMVS
jgi:hypothetical protein